MGVIEDGIGGMNFGLHIYIHMKGLWNERLMAVMEIL